MARVPEFVEREDLPENERHYFDAVTGSRGQTQLRGPFPTMMNLPELTKRIAHVGDYVRFETSLSPIIRELTIIATAKECGCEIEWNGHVKRAREEGLREEAIEVLDRGGPLHQLNEEEAEIVGFARELIHEHRVSDATFEAVKSRYGIQGAVEVTGTIGYYTVLAFMIAALKG